jgi:hypothetical protein
MDLTFQPFVDNMGAIRSICFPLSEGIIKEEEGVSSQNLEICEVPRSGGGQFFPGFICRQGQFLVDQRGL